MARYFLAIFVLAIFFHVTIQLPTQRMNLRSKQRWLALLERYMQMHKMRDGEGPDENEYLVKRSCVALGGTGCEANNGKCCRKGNPYTGEMRKCNNEGSFMSPKYVCREQ